MQKFLRSIRHLPKMSVAAAVVLIALTASSMVVHDNHQDNMRKQNQAAEQAERAKVQKTLDQKKADIANAEAKAVPTPTNNQSTAPAPTKPATPPVKYSTSSDPRSTAYSTTPPGPNPADVDIQITHAGQVPAGTLISYNATKNEKTYYAGDLSFSPATLTISKTGGTALRADFTASIPDGQTSTPPNTLWNDPQRIAFPAFSSSPADGTSFTMFLQLYSNTVPNGTYQIHLTSGRAGQTADAWVYHGFITLNVVD